MNNNSFTKDQPRSLFAAVSFSAVAIIIFNALPVIMGVASDALALSAEQMGVMASAELGGIGLTSVSGLFWIRKLPWRRAVLFGTLALAAGNVLSIFAETASTLIALRFLTGLVGEGVVFTVAIAAIGDAKNTDRAFAYSIVGQVGLGMVALWGFPYIALAAGFAGIMCTMTVLALACLVLLPWLPAGGVKVLAPEGPALVAAGSGSNSIPLLGLLGMVCWFIGLSGIWAFLERIGMEVPMQQTSIGSLLSLGLGLGALASLAVALIGDRYGRYWPPLAAIAAHAVLCFLFGGQLTAFAYGLMVLLITFVWNIGLPYLLGLIADSDSTGRMVVLVVTAQAFGNTLGPLVAGQVVELRGLSSVGYSSALFCLLALMILGFFMYRVRLMLSLKPEAIELPI